MGEEDVVTGSDHISSGNTRTHANQRGGVAEPQHRVKLIIIIIIIIVIIIIVIIFCCKSELHVLVLNDYTCITGELVPI